MTARRDVAKGVPPIPASRGSRGIAMLTGNVRGARSIPIGGSLAWLGAALLALGTAARLHNAWSAPVLAGYDAFGHFTYVWFVAETGRIPLPTQGWSFFHPPFYYACMAGLWNALDGADPAFRLKTGKVLLAALGLVHSFVAWRIVRRRPWKSPAACWAAALLNLLVPVHLYTAGFLGNEALGGVLGSLAILVLVGLIEAPGDPARSRARIARAALLGILLGLAMLTKTSAAAVVAGCFAAIATSALVRREVASGVQAGGVALVVMLVVCGPWYARNVEVYGTPFQLSRSAMLVRFVEDNQPQATRRWADYVTFDPMIFRRPVWPRDQSPLSGGGGERDFGRSVRESVWTGIYANTWFDGFGGWVLPPVVESEAARRAGQLLMLLGIAPTLLVIAGFAGALARLRRGPPDDTQIAFLWITTAMLALLLLHTKNAPIAAAVKPSYLAPASVAFAFWLAEGIRLLEKRRPSLARAAVSACAAAGIASLAVFWQGFLFDAHAIRSSLPWLEDAKLVQLGVVEHAGGRTDQAHALFQRASASGYHLAWENLGFLEIDAGRREKGLKLLRRASRLQAAQQVAGPELAAEFQRMTAAENEHSMAVVLHDLGRRERAVEMWYRALRHDPRHAEALYSLALTQLEDGLADRDEEALRRPRLEDARRAVANARTLDPGLAEAWHLEATVDALLGDCAAARKTMDEWRELPWWTTRSYPVETGTGAGFAASIGRRRLVQPSARELTSRVAFEACGL
jgi:tetratricopeptide (TPR) repeat protein